MPKLTIIAAIVDYRDRPGAHLPALGDELDGIQKALQPAIAAGLCELKIIADLTAEKLVEAVHDAKHPVVGFHFAGHATERALVLREDAHREGLAAFLGRQSSLRFVFLNGCSSAGHLPTLHQAGIPAVIATDNAINDQQAKAIAISFYEQLGKGRPLETAFYHYQAPHDIKRSEASRKLDMGEVSDYPWRLSYKPGAEAEMKVWSLAIAAEQPLFGLPPIAPKFDLPAQPFRYLEGYGHRHAPVFFGRSSDIRRLYEYLNDAHLSPILLLYGQSGVGKSSLLEAGLLPRLEEAYAAKTVRRNPEGGLPASLLTAISAANLPEEQARQQWLAQEAALGKPLILVLDQAEEIFTQAAGHPEAELGGLLRLLSNIFDQTGQRPRGKLILSFRQEYYAGFADALSARLLPYSAVPIAPLSHSGIIEAVEGLAHSELLARQYGLTAEPGLAQMIADDLLETPHSPIAPMLQVLLTEMWNRSAPGDRQFTIELYRSVKRQGIQLADFVAQKLAAVRAEHPAAERSGLDLDVLYCFTTPLATAAQHTEEAILARYRGREDEVRRLLEAMSSQYLLSKTTEDLSCPTYRLAHDTLAPIVRREFDASDRPGQLAEKIIGSAALSHHAGLLNEQQLQLVQAGQHGMRAWTSTETGWIERSGREIKQQQQRRRRLRWLTAAAAALLVVLLGWGYRSELSQRKLSQSQALASQAELAAAAQPTLAIRLLQQSLAILPDPSREAKLFELLRDNLLADTLFVAPSRPALAAIAPNGRTIMMAFPADHGEMKAQAFRYADGDWSAQPLERPRSKSSLYDLVFSADGLKAFGGGKSHQLHQWGADGTGLATSQYNHPPLFFHSLAANANGTKLATLTEVNDQFFLQLWEVPRDKQLANIPLADRPRAVQFAPDDEHMLVGMDSGELLVLSQSGERRGGWPGTGEALTSIAVHHQQGKLAVAAQQTVYLLQAAGTELRLLDSLHYPEAAIQRLAFSPDGRLLLTASADRRVGLWRLEDGRLLYLLREHEAPVLGLGFAQAGQQILTTDESGVVRKWDLPPLFPAQRIAQEGYIERLQLWPVGTSQRLVAAVGQAPVKQWDIPSGQALGAFEGHEDWVSAFALTADGYCLSGDNYGQLHYWSLANPVAAAPLNAHQEAITAIALALDGQHFVTVALSQEVYVWERSSKTLVDSLPHPSFVADLAFAKGGAQLWTIAQDGKLRIWSAKNWALQKEVEFDEAFSPLLLAASEHTPQVLLAGERGAQGVVIGLKPDAARAWEVILPQGPPNAIAQRRPPGAPAYAFGMDDGLILLADERGRVFHQLQAPSGQRILSLDWAGDYLVSGCAGGELLLWKDVDRGRRLER